MRRTIPGRLLIAAATMGAAVLAPASPAGAATAELQRLAPGVAIYEAGAFAFSVPGNVTASATFVDVQIPPSATPNTSTSGCDAADFAGFPAGNIAVIQRGTCTFAVKAALAEAAGASAVVIFNEGQPGRTDLFPANLGGPGITIPVAATSFAVGQELYGIDGNVTLRVAVTIDAPICAEPPAVGTPMEGKNLVVAQPGGMTLGTAGADVIYGTPGPDRIAGLGGDDIVFGFGGSDKISGGDGDLTLCGGADNDSVSGGAGSDVLSGDDVNDDLSGDAGDDTLVDRLGTNRAVGGEGTDFCSPFGTPESQSSTCETVEGPI